MNHLFRNTINIILSLFTFFLSLLYIFRFPYVITQYDGCLSVKIVCGIIFLYGIVYFLFKKSSLYFFFLLLFSNYIESVTVWAVGKEHVGEFRKLGYDVKSSMEADIILSALSEITICAASEWFLMNAVWLPAMAFYPAALLVYLIFVVWQSAVNADEVMCSTVFVMSFFKNVA